MQVSIDGLRKNMARSYSSIVRGYKDIREGREFGMEELEEAIESMRMDIVAFMCIYSEDTHDMCSNMSDEAEKLLCVHEE